MSTRQTDVLKKNAGLYTICLLTLVIIDARVPYYHQWRHIMVSSLVAKNIVRIYVLYSVRLLGCCIFTFGMLKNVLCCTRYKRNTVKIKPFIIHKKSFIFSYLWTKNVQMHLRKLEKKIWLHSQQSINQWHSLYLHQTALQRSQHPHPQ